MLCRHKHQPDYDSKHPEDVDLCWQILPYSPADFRHLLSGCCLCSIDQSPVPGPSQRCTVERAQQAVQGPTGHQLAAALPKPSKLHPLQGSRGEIMLQTPSAGSLAAVGGGLVALQHYCEGAMAVGLHPV